MRKLNGIIFDKVAPNDPDFLWLNANGLFVCEGGQWINVYKSLVDTVSTLDSDLNTAETGLKAKVNSIDEDLTWACNNITGGTAEVPTGIIGRIENLELTVFHEKTEPSNNEETIGE